MRLILQILLIMLVVSTLSICTIKPKMHKSVIVYDSSYTLVPEKVSEVETKEIPVMEKSVESSVVTKKTEQNIIPVQKTQNKETIKNEKTKISNPVTQNKISKSETVSNKSQKQTQNQQKQTESASIQQKVRTEEPIVQKTQTKEIKQPKILNQAEEEIAWNVWRSNLQNKIMQDTKLPIIPNGIVFRFSFSVDRYGKISNLQTWSDTPMYNPYAIQYLAPAIRNLQGRSILNFPEGSTRMTTNVKGGWKISANERYSTPQDYNDIEKIKH